MWTSISMRGRVDHLGAREGIDQSSIRSSTDFLSFLFSRSYLPRYEGPFEPLAFIRIRSCADLPFKREILPKNINVCNTIIDFYLNFTSNYVYQFF